MCPMCNIKLHIQTECAHRKQTSTRQKSKQKKNESSGETNRMERIGARTTVEDPSTKQKQKRTIFCILFFASSVKYIVSAHSLLRLSAIARTEKITFILCERATTHSNRDHNFCLRIKVEFFRRNYQFIETDNINKE